MADDRTVTELGADEVRSLCGSLLDWQVEAILALKPAAADVVAAAGWASGLDELGQEGRPLSGVVAQIYDVMIAGEPAEEDR